MTCIIGLVETGKVYMGGDSCGSNGYNKSIRLDEKVFLNGEFLIGFTTSFRMGQVLRYAFEPPTCDTWDIRRYMVADFVPALQSCFADHGWKKQETDGETRGGSFLVGVRGQLFSIEDDFQVGCNADPYSACGSGTMVALGSMFSTTGQEPVSRIKIALEAASYHACGVAGPFTVLNL